MSGSASQRIAPLPRPHRESPTWRTSRFSRLRSRARKRAHRALDRICATRQRRHYRLRQRSHRCSCVRGLGWDRQSYSRSRFGRYSQSARDVVAAGALRCLFLPPSASEIAELSRALRPRSVHHRVDVNWRFVLDPVARTIHWGNESARLSEREFAIVDFLSRHSGAAVDFETLLRYVAPASSNGERAKRSLDVHVCNLRRKLTDIGLHSAIKTVRGYGYVLRTSQPSAGST